MPRVAAVVAIALGLAAPAGASAADQDRFDVWEYRVSGNTLLGAAAVERAVYAKLGPGRGIADVEQARTALEEAYRQAGYPTVLVDVPEQEIADGVVRLQVTEGRVDRLIVTGSRYFANGWLREQVPELRPGSVPGLPAFQSQLRALNARSPDRTVTPVLRPGRAPGTVEAELKVADELPLHANAEVNNRNTADTTDTRLSATLSYGNLWQREHALSLQYQVAPEDKDESEVWALSYVLKPERSDKSFIFYAVDSDSDIASVAALDVIGNGRIVGGQMIWPLPASDALYHNVVLGAAWKDFDETLGFDDPDEEDIETPIDYINWSAGYTATIVGESRRHGLGLTANFGIRDVANEPNDLVPNPGVPGGFIVTGEFEDKRSGSRPNYFYLNGRYDVSQDIPWGATLYWNVSGQLSTQPLVSNEQFAVGGVDSVRGYYEAELLGDYGIQSTFEWQGPNLGPKLWKRLGTLQGLVFTDFGRVALQDPLPDQEDGFTAWSAGVGLRLDLQGLVGALDWAWPMRDGTSTEAGDERLLFRVRYGF
jgi:hemolysin activation/secretion protein